jgi:hypothetical protein
MEVNLTPSWEEEDETIWCRRKKGIFFEAG